MNIKNSKIIGVIVGILLFILLGMGLTYAYVTWTSPKINKNVISKCFNVLYTKGSDITGTLMPSDTYKGGLSTIIKMNMDSSCDIDGEGIIKLNTENTTSSNLYREGLLNYAIEKDNKLIKEGAITGSGVKEISVGKLDRNSSATTSYKLYVWVDNKLVNNNDVDLIYSGNISGEVRQYMPPKLVQLISNLYNDATKSNAVNNSINYHYADSVSLMNDRLGGLTPGLDDGNIRYYGINPNNYIMLGNDKNNDLYRIIGLFKDIKVDNKNNARIKDGSLSGYTKDLIKVIKVKSIGNYSWDTSNDKNNGQGVNQWGESSSYEGADLMRLLNPGYNGINGSLWWNGTSTNNDSGCYNNSNNLFDKNCNFLYSGLDNSIKDKIENVVWNLGSGSSSSIFSDEIYSIERGTLLIDNPSDKINRTATWIGKIALMYPSDYGYAVDFNFCDSDLLGYENGSCPKNNWLNNNETEWFLTPSTYDATFVWFKKNTGRVRGFNAYHAYSVRPVFYLNSNIKVETGNGSFDDPYRIKM